MLPNDPFVFWFLIFLSLATSIVLTLAVTLAVTLDVTLDVTLGNVIIANETCMLVAGQFFKIVFISLARMQCLAA